MRDRHRALARALSGTGLAGPLGSRRIEWRAWMATGTRRARMLTAAWGAETSRRPCWRSALLSGGSLPRPARFPLGGGGGGSPPDLALDDVRRSQGDRKHRTTDIAVGTASPICGRPDLPYHRAKGAQKELVGDAIRGQKRHRPGRPPATTPPSQARWGFPRRGFSRLGHPFPGPGGRSAQPTALELGHHHPGQRPR